MLLVFPIYLRLQFTTYLAIGPETGPVKPACAMRYAILTGMTLFDLSITTVVLLKICAQRFTNGSGS